MLAENKMNLSVFKSDLALAVIFSLLAHLFFMTAVSIVTPEDFFKTEPFTKVTFLGPILEKTAFDIMMGGEEEVDPGGDIVVPGNLLKTEIDVTFSGKGSGSAGFPHNAGKVMYDRVKISLSGDKISPRIFIGSDQNFAQGNALKNSFSQAHIERAVIYRPLPPVIEGFRDEDGRGFTVKVSAFIDDLGVVIEPRIVRSSGDISVDMEVLNYFSGWKFQPREAIFGRKEFFETEIKISPGRADKL